MGSLRKARLQVRSSILLQEEETGKVADIEEQQA